MNPEANPQAIVDNAVRKYSYSNFPFFSKKSLKAYLWALAVFTGLVAFVGWGLKSISSGEMVTIIIAFTVLQVLYYIFYVIPSVWYLRKTGRFLYIPRGYPMRLERAPFYSPLGRDPFRYGGTQVKWPYIKGTFWMVVFSFVIVLPFLAIISVLLGL